MTREEKRAAYDKAYYEANKEKRLASQKAWYEANNEKKAAYNKAYYEANKEKQVARGKAWKSANKEKRLAYDKAYYEANKEKRLASSRAWNEANPEKRNEHHSKRRALKLKAIPEHLRECPFEKNRITQTYKLSNLMTKITGIEHHVDHMWPLSKGGPHWSGNLQVIPAPENLSKKDKLCRETSGVLGKTLSNFVSERSI
tara:strand:- start:27955 stop:28554 length:600 start_codon:yes stop_codon:yes gene_type:complete